MDLLVLSTWFPYPPDNGSRLRAYHLLRQLSRRNTIRLVAGVQEDIADEVAGGVPEPLRELCAEVVTVPWRWYHAERVGAWRSLVSVKPRSVLETESPEIRAAVAAALQRRPGAVLAMELGMVPFLAPTRAPIVVDQVEISGMDRLCQEARGAARLRHGLTRWKAHRYWRRALKGVAAVTAVSEEEARAVRGMVGGDGPPVAVVPNGVEVGSYARVHGRAVPGRLLYNGSLSYGPNRAAVRWFAREVLPRIAAAIPEAHLVVTGRAEGLDIDDLRANERIRLTGFLPDLRPALDEAALCVVPLLEGGGTRLKVLEAFAAELPVVSTRRGAAGIEARDGEHLLLADAPDELAEAVIGLLKEPEVARALAVNARWLAQERYDWAGIGARLSELLVCVTERGRQAA